MSTTRHHIETDQPLTRAADVRAASLDREARTVDVVISTGAMVRRRGWTGEYDEAIPVDRARLDRINSIGAVLDNHRSWGSVADTLGAVVPGSVRVEGSALVGTLRFARTDKGDQVLGLIEDGILRAVSVGYDVDEYTETKPKDRTDGGKRSLLQPTSWTPYEVSVVQMPADAGATVRAEGAPEIRRYAVRSTEETTIMAETTQTQQAPAIDEAKVRAEERKRFSERLARFEAIGTSHKLDLAKVRALVEKNDDDGAVGLAMLEMAAQRQQNDIIAHAQPPQATIGREAADKLIEARSLGLAARMLPNRYGPKATDEAVRGAMRMSLLDHARSALEAAGIRARDLDKRQVAEMALSSQFLRSGGLQSTSDFPYLLANTQNKILMDLYQERQSPWRAFARRMDRPDFKSFTMPQRSAAPSLQEVPESAIVPRDSYAERTPETGRLKTAGITVAFTRQMLINDDLAAFTESTLGLAAAAIRHEDDTANALITANPTMADNETLFSSAHANISTGTGAPSIDNLHLAMITMAAQTGLKGERLNLRPRFLYSAFKENLTAQQVLATPPRMVPVTAATTLAQDATGLELLWDNRLSDGSGVSDWYLIADPAQAPGLYYGGLEGDPSPRLSMEVEFSTDGIVRKLVHDFNAWLADYRWIVQTTD